MGLWAAWQAEKAGIATLLVDRAKVGGATSNGLLGALMAYMPDQWDEKKQFQFEALIALEDAIKTVEAQTGVSTGYRRTGRIMPLFSERQLKTAQARQDAARENWRTEHRSFQWSVVDTPPVSGWPAETGDALSYVIEDLAAHVFPRGLVAALISGLRKARHVRVLDGINVVRIAADEKHLLTGNGDRIGFDKLIVSAGIDAFSLLQPLFAPDGAPLGRPVKGQAALLSAELDPELPIVFDNGLYVVPHSGGRVAVGSTTEDDFEAPFDTDHRLDGLIAAARRAVPALSGAPVVERWAGLRPRGVHREPMIGALNAWPDIIALGGGFKTSFGIAHRLADHAISLALGNHGEKKALPAIYDLDIYLKRANKTAK